MSKILYKMKAFKDMTPEELAWVDQAAQKLADMIIYNLIVDENGVPQPQPLNPTPEQIAQMNSDNTKFKSHFDKLHQLT